MKKLFILAILLASTVFAGLMVEAQELDLIKSGNNNSINSVSTQISIQIGNRRGNQQRRWVTRTRRVRWNRHYYRETYRVRYLRNGRQQRQVIRRVRIY